MNAISDLTRENLKLKDMLRYMYFLLQLFPDPHWIFDSKQWREGFREEVRW